MVGSEDFKHPYSLGVSMWRKIEPKHMPAPPRSLPRRRLIVECFSFADCLKHATEWRNHIFLYGDADAPGRTFIHMRDRPVADIGESVGFTRLMLFTSYRDLVWYSTKSARMGIRRCLAP